LPPGRLLLIIIILSASTDLNSLADINKPRSNGELQGILGLAAFVLGFLAGE
jgi:hypothetical protein